MSAVGHIPGVILTSVLSILTIFDGPKALWSYVPCEFSFSDQPEKKLHKFSAYYVRIGI